MKRRARGRERKKERGFGGGLRPGSGKKGKKGKPRLPGVVWEKGR